MVNATASSVTPAHLARVRAALRAAGDLEVRPTTGRGHAGDLAREALAAGADCVAVLGGDGTLNETAGPLVGTGCALAPLPGGSTSVFCRTLGYPTDPAAAAEEVVRSLRRGAVERIGVGEVRAGDAPARPFVCHTGIGWDAALVAGVERHAHLKRHATTAVFTAAGLQALFATYDRGRPQFDVCFDGDGGRPATVPGVFTLVLNSDPYTFVQGRPFTVAPSADLHRPVTVVTLRRMPLVPFAGMVARSLAGRGLRPAPGVDIRTDVTSLRVRRRPASTMPHQVDGDHLGDVAELRFRHRPDALDVVVPVERALSRARGPAGRPPERW